MAKTIMEGPYLEYQGKKTNIRICSVLKRLRGTFPEIDAELYSYFYNEVMSSLLVEGTKERVRCRAATCVGKALASTRTVYFIEVTKDIYAGPMCAGCAREHVQRTEKPGGEVSDLRIYSVFASEKGLERIRATDVIQTRVHATCTQIDPKVRLF